MKDRHDKIVKPLPKWIMYKYAQLWQQFKENDFEHKAADGIIKDNSSVVLMHMKKGGWLTIQLHPEDSRKRIYRLKSPEQAMEEMAK